MLKASLVFFAWHSSVLNEECFQFLLSCSAGIAGYQQKGFSPTWRQASGVERLRVKFRIFQHSFSFLRVFWGSSLTVIFKCHLSTFSTRRPDLYSGPDCEILLAGEMSIPDCYAYYLTMKKTR